MDAANTTSTEVGPLVEAGVQIERFAAGLDERERAALQVFLLKAAARMPITELAATPPQAILKAPDLAVYEKLRAEPMPIMRGGRKVLTVIVKATRLCNLRCTYCHSWKEGPGQVMGFPVLARTIRDALRDPSVS